MVRYPVLALLLIAAACGGGSDAITVERQASSALQDCMRDVTNAYIRLYAQVELLASVAEGGVIPPNLTWEESTNPQDPPFTYYFVLGLDIGGDPFPDIEIDGRASFDADPTDGIDVGDCLMLDGDIAPVQDASVSIFGFLWGMVEFAAANRIEVSGPAAWENVLENCRSEMNASEQTPLSITFPNSIISGGAPPQTAVEILGLQASGAFDRMDVDQGSDRFRGTATLPDQSQVASYTGTVNGGGQQTIDIELFPSDAEIDALAQCLADQQVVFVALSGAIEKLTDLFIEGGRNLQTIPDADGLTITPTGSASVVNYTLDLDTFTNGAAAGTQTGQLSKFRDTVVGGSRFTTFQISYELTTSSVPGVPNFTGRNGFEIPWRADIQPDDSYTYYGTGSIDFAGGCDTDWAVPEGDQLEPDEEETRDGPHEAGTNQATIERLPNVLTTRLDYTGSGIFAFDIFVNGIEVPSSALDQPIFDD